MSERSDRTAEMTGMWVSVQFCSHVLIQIKYNCYLPPFCHFSPEEWENKGHEYDEVRDCMLGWDITDFGLGNFDKVGFSLITIRNGCRKQPEKYPKVYAEKLLYLKEGQTAANHFHWYKTEDIINRGGGACLIRV